MVTKTAGTPTTPMTNYQKAHHLLHVLWTKAVGTKDYDKKQWQELETAIYRLIKPDFDDADTPPIESLHQFTGRGLPALAGRGSPSPFVVDLVSGVLRARWPSW